MNNKNYFRKCITFNRVLLDLACGDVVLCTPDYLELRVKDDDGFSHNVILNKATIRLFGIILNDYLKSL